jgi:hypothetical protein
MISRLVYDICISIILRFTTLGWFAKKTDSRNSLEIEPVRHSQSLYILLNDSVAFGYAHCVKD